MTMPQNTSQQVPDGSTGATLQTVYEVTRAQRNEAADKAAFWEAAHEETEQRHKSAVESLQARIIELVDELDRMREELQAAIGTGEESGAEGQADDHDDSTREGAVHGGTDGSPPHPE